MRLSAESTFKLDQGELQRHQGHGLDHKRPNAPGPTLDRSADPGTEFRKPVVSAAKGAPLFDDSNLYGWGSVTVIVAGVAALPWYWAQAPNASCSSSSPKSGSGSMAASSHAFRVLAGVENS